jgi:hypothetical protein
MIVFIFILPLTAARCLPPIETQYYGFAAGGGGGSGFGIRKVHEKPKTIVRPSGRAKARYSS